MATEKDKKHRRSYEWFGKPDRDNIWKAPPPHDVRGYVKLYCDHVNQADQGVDLDFLVGKSGAPVPRESH